MTQTGPALFQAYGDALRRHAHWLIAEGYQRMDATAFARVEEPAITGELVRKMRAFLESGSNAPAWVAYYAIHDDPPLDAGGRRGRSRLRVDIEFERVTAGTRPRLRFEAKRLCTATGHTVAKYLGEEGLGCFLSGRYPTTHGEAGMLGYVQSENEAGWAGRIASELSRCGQESGIVSSPLAQQQTHAALRHTYISHHQQRPDKDLTIHHVLLLFK